MKIRESGMPEENYWETFFDPEYIFKALEIKSGIKGLAEFGSGYGTFTIPAAKIIQGIVYAFDIDKEMNERLNKRIIEDDISNIKVITRDFVTHGTGLQDNAVDYVMLFNILHAENPVGLLSEAYRILKPGGKAGIIHWIYSSETPRGPSMDIRPKPGECISWLQEAKFKILKNEIELPPYHYGILGQK